VKSKLEMKRPILAELSIEVPADEIQSAINKAFASLSRRAKIRGFRQGKAPRAVLKRMFGDAIIQEVRGDIINNTLLSALAEHELVPLAPPDLDAPDVREGADYSFTAAFEVRPKLENINYDGVKLERVVSKVEASEVDAELERLRSAMASLIDLTSPRPIEKGDVAVISLRRSKGDGWEESGLNDQQVVIGEGHAPESVESALIGMNVGDEKVVELGPDTEPEEKKLRYLMKLTDHKERKLPALDDELAKDTGDYDTLEALKEDIRKRLKDAKDRNEERRLQNALYDALREKNPMELPPSLVSRQAEALKNQLYRGVIEELGKNPDQDNGALEKLEENALKTAGEMVHQQFLMMEIARLSDIKVEDEDVDAEIEKRATASGVPVPMLRAEMNKAERREELALQILETKIFDFAKSLVNITEVEGELKKASSAEGDSKKEGVVKAAAGESSPKTEESAKKAADDTDNSPGGAKTKKKAVAKKAAAEKEPEKAAEKNSGEVKTKKKAASKTAATKKTGGAAAKKTTSGSPAKKTTSKKAATKKTPAEK
jgi:trigger factor